MTAAKVTALPDNSVRATLHITGTNPYFLTEERDLKRLSYARLTESAHSVYLS